MGVDNLVLAIRAALVAGKAIMDVYTQSFEVYTKSDDSPITQADLRASAIIKQMLEQSQLPFVCEEDLMFTYAERSRFVSYWLVDPLDGTKEFVNRNGEFTVNIALIENNKPTMGVIYAPVADTLWFNFGDLVFKTERASQVNINTPLALPLLVKHNHEGFVVLVSRSHRTSEVDDYIDHYLRPQHKNLIISTKGSSLKFASLAEGDADIYVCYSKTKEWDTAAAEAILTAAGGCVKRISDCQPLEYNKEEYGNPPFVAINFQNRRT